MKRLVLIALLFLLVIAPHQPWTAEAQGDDDCEPEAVKTWLLGLQSWMNATWSLMQTDTELGDDAWIATLLVLHDHLDAIDALPRPACADDAMVWVYRSYNVVDRLFLCVQAWGFSEQATICMEKANVYDENGFEAAMSELESIAGISLADYEDELYPEGWSLEADIALIQSSAPGGATEAEASATAEVTGSGFGTRSNPYPLGEWASFSEGRVRVVSVDPDYQSQNYTPDEGERFIDVVLEYECQLEDENESCTGGRIAHSAAYVTPQGNVLDDAGTYEHYIGSQEGYSGALLQGSIQFAIPAASDLGQLRLSLDEDTFFTLQ